MTVQLPRTGTTVLVVLTLAASLAPGLLPRGPAAQGLFSGALAAAVLLPLAAARPVTTRIAWLSTSRQSTRILALLAAVVCTAVLLIAADHWQDGLRQAMGLAVTGPAHWITAIMVAVATFAVLRLSGLAVARIFRRLGPIRSVSALAVCAVTLQLFVGPTIWDRLTRSYSASNSVVDLTLARPVAPTLSGSSHSQISWESLGTQGRRFVTGQGTSIRTYVGIESAAEVNERAALAVAELRRAGGFERSALVVAVPTGSGWIDANAVAGFEERFHGDVAVVGMQYSAAPSWVTFLFDRTAADTSARALLDAVTTHLQSLPTSTRPNLYLYGQSLGAVGGSAAFDSAERVCGALWAGPPARTIPTPGATVLANSSDPVVRWSPQLIWRAPDLRATRTDAPRPAWIPLVSFLQTSLDLAAALSVPAGHGHRYGVDQGTELPRCASERRELLEGNEIQAGSAIGPRAVSYAAPTR